MTEKSENQISSLQPKLVVGIALALAFSLLLATIFLPKNDSYILYFDSPTDTKTSLPAIPNTPSTTDVEDTSSVESSKVSSTAETSSVVSTVSSTPVVVEENNIINYKSRQTYSMMWKGIENLCKEYPEFLSYSVYGKSTKGRSLPLVKMGTGAKKGLIVAGIHGTEHITTTYALRCIEDYCRAYVNGGRYGNYNLVDLFNKYTLYIVPNCNPDGSEIAHNGDSPLVSVANFKRWEYKANANGVNLNRNFPFYFDGINLMKNPKPDNEYYKGPSGGSEIETKELMELCNENSFSFMLSLHARGNITYWSDVITPNAGGITSGLCSKIQSVTGIVKTSSPTSNPSSYGGGFENWFRYTYQRPGICVELMNAGITGSTSGNEQNFDSHTIWYKTKYLFALTMDYVS
ncbi:MAG: hypothetical protein IJ944_05760 [Clostridia bacterium]|nr:hypothetical protein [Clostridia bacterium]